LRHVRVLQLPILVTVLSIAPAASLMAQPHSLAPFVDLRLGPDVDDVKAFKMSGATRRVGVALGVDWGRSGVEFDIAVPGWHTDVTGTTEVYTGPSNFYQTRGHVYESSDTVRRRSVDISLLYRFNIPVHRRVTCTWLLGAAQAYRPEHETRTLTEVLPDGTRRNVHVVSSTDRRDYVAGVSRVDADVRIGGHLWLGPRFTLTMYPAFWDKNSLAPRGFVGRTDLAVRWRF
jgi:hypothetical protein